MECNFECCILVGGPIGRGFKIAQPSCQCSRTICRCTHCEQRKADVVATLYALIDTTHSALRDVRRTAVFALPEKFRQFAIRSSRPSVHFSLNLSSSCTARRATLARASARSPITREDSVSAQKRSAARMTLSQTLSCVQKRSQIHQRWHGAAAAHSTARAVVSAVSSSRSRLRCAASRCSISSYNQTSTAVAKDICGRQPMPAAHCGGNGRSSGGHSQEHARQGKAGLHCRGLRWAVSGNAPSS